MKHLKVVDAMKLLGFSQPTLSAWEGGRKSPSIEKLELMADVYEVSTDYLLGHISAYKNIPSNPVSPASLPVLHEQPLWSPDHGWLLVNSIEKHLVRPDGNTIPFSAAGDLYTTPPVFSVPETPVRTTTDTGADTYERGNVGRTDFPGFQTKRRTAGMVSQKRPVCGKRVWEPVLSGYL